RGIRARDAEDGCQPRRVRRVDRKQASAGVRTVLSDELRERARAHARTTIAIGRGGTALAVEPDAAALTHVGATTWPARARRAVAVGLAREPAVRTGEADVRQECPHLRRGLAGTLACQRGARAGEAARTRSGARAARRRRSGTGAERDGGDVART